MVYSCSFPGLRGSSRTARCRSSCLLSGQSWPKRSPGGSAADADARWRHGDFSSAHDSSRPNWTAAHADRRSHSHGRRGRRIRINKESSLLDRCGDHRRDQSERSRSRAVPFDRTSRPVPRGSCPQPHGSIRVVHAGRFACNGSRRLLRRRSCGGCAEGIPLYFRQLPCSSPSLRRPWSGAGVLIHTLVVLRGSRYVCDASQWSIRKGFSRCWSFPLDCFEVIELVRPRLLRWWFCSAKLCRILVLSAIRGSSVEARPHFLLGQCVGGNLGAARIALGDAYRARADDGGDAFAVECFAHSCAAYDLVLYREFAAIRPPEEAD